MHRPEVRSVGAAGAIVSVGAALPTDLRGAGGPTSVQGVWRTKLPDPHSVQPKKIKTGSYFVSNNQLNLGINLFLLFDVELNLSG